MSIMTLMLIIGVVALIFTVVMVSMLKAHKSILTTYLQNFTGILFIFSGWVKAVDPMGTAFKMVDYFTEFEATFKETAMSFIAPIFPYLSEHALAFAIFMIIFEIILGIMLLLGDRPKLTSWLFFLLVLFFTVLTGFTFLTGYVPMDKNFFSFSEWTEYVSTNMRVRDCGCFGDFIKLDPKISFFKDLFLMIPAIYFLFKNGEFHQLLTQKSRNLTLLFSTFFLILYCIYNFYWDEPHVDFRPFRNGANIAAIQKAEKESSAAVQVLTMRMKNKKTGEIKNIPYGEYMKNLSALTEEYETIEQIKTEPTIKPTKISEFSITDFDGEEKSDLYLANKNAHIMVPIYKAKYKAVHQKRMVKDSVFTTDTVRIEGVKDSFQLVKNFVDVKDREEDFYETVWDESFIATLKSVIKPLQDAALKDNITMSIVVSGIDADKAKSLASVTGINAQYLTGDEKLIKTIMRSNPGIILWKDGVLLHKWHYKKFPGWEKAKAEFLH